jgi:hypothetical protein
MKAIVLCLVASSLLQGRGGGRTFCTTPEGKLNVVHIPTPCIQYLPTLSTPPRAIVLCPMALS